MSEEMGFLRERVTKWTVDQMQRAEQYDREHPGVIAESTMDTVRARLETATAQRRLSDEKITRATERRRMLVSFTDASHKPAKSIDYVSVKQGVEDASKTVTGGGGITVGTLAAIYAYLSTHHELIDWIPGPIVWSAIIMGFGVWVIHLLVRLKKKWFEEFPL